MLTSDFDYQLPAELIAQEALPRGASRLLRLPCEGELRHLQIADLVGCLQENDLLVVNDTRVRPARLFAKRRESGGQVELLLVEAFGECEWAALVKPGRHARPGDLLDLDQGVDIEILSTDDDGLRRVRFSEPIEPHLDRVGHIPLPPYIKRPDRDSDRERYQTVFAQEVGAIAAPTAGLHFDRPLLDRLRARGIKIASVTLHVGIGTFRPVTAKLVHEHRMDKERFTVPAATAAAIEATRSAGARVVAVGTTVTRTLEAIALDHDGRVVADSGSTDLFITPGYRFQVVDLLLTNFHLPKSTLLMLVSAFAGRERVLAAYLAAIHERYRFFSYGDAMLLDRAADGA